MFVFVKLRKKRGTRLQLLIKLNYYVLYAKTTAASNKSQRNRCAGAKATLKTNTAESNSLKM